MIARSWFVAIILLLLFTGCAEHKTELEVSERVRLVEFFPYQNRGHNLRSAVPQKQVLEVDDEVFDLDCLENGRVVRVFDECGEVFLIVLNNHTRFVGILDRRGKVDYLCDLLEIGFESITKLSCQIEDEAIRLTVGYSYVNERHVREMKSIEKLVPFNTDFRGAITVTEK